MCCCVFTSGLIELFRTFENLLGDRRHHWTFRAWICHQFNDLKEDYSNRDMFEEDGIGFARLLVTIDRLGVHFSPRTSRPAKREHEIKAIDSRQWEPYKCCHRP